MDILPPELTSLTSYLCNNNLAPPSAAIAFITYCMMRFVHSLYCPSPPLKVASKGTGTLILGPYSILTASHSAWDSKKKKSANVYEIHMFFWKEIREEHQEDFSCVQLWSSIVSCNVKYFIQIKCFTQSILVCIAQIIFFSNSFSINTFP